MGMNLVAILMLVGDRLKYVALVAGLAFATLLITQQGSILVGMADQTGAFIRDTGQADLWVMDPEVEFSEDGKALQDTALFRVRGVEGVEWAVPIYKNWLKAQLPDGRKLNMIVVGIDDATLVGGPPMMVEGQLDDLRADKAVFIDARDADTKLLLTRGRFKDNPQPLRMGDRLAVNDFDLRVAGTMKLSRSFFWDPVVYTTYSRALAFAPPERRLMSFVLVKVKSGTDIAETARSITEATGLQALTGKQFEKLTMTYILEKTGILVNFGLAVGMGFVIGLLVAAQTLYAFTLDNLKQYGALKAMGAGNGTLIRMMAVQVLIVALLGYGLGLGITVLIGKLIVATDLAFLMTWHIPVVGGVAILIICLCAGAASIAKVLRLEPAIVFKS
ncbi:MAG: ABC transporter permease [Phycisphaerales bacterium]|nr:ABC transporter permease [Phycisphaerales bacterium]